MRFWIAKHVPARSPFLARLLATVVALVILGPFGAYAEDASLPSYFGDVRWRTSRGPVAWSFTSDFPAGALRDRVVDAFGSWNKLGLPLEFAPGPTAWDFPAGLEPSCEAPHGVGNGGRCRDR